MTEITAAERDLLELIRNDSETINTAIGYLRYYGKKESERATSDYDRKVAQCLLTFGDALADAKNGWRAGP